MNGLSPHAVAGQAGMLATLAVVGVIGLAAACVSPLPVSPLPVSSLPVEMPSPAIATSAARPSASATKPAQRPPRSPAPSSTPASPSASASACMGAVVFTVDASEDGPPWPAYCVAVGALLRLENQGPEGVSVSPPENAPCTYEAAVRECRFLETGTVRFTIVRETDTRTLTVVVVD